MGTNVEEARLVNGVTRLNGNVSKGCPEKPKHKKFQKTAKDSKELKKNARQKSCYKNMPDNFPL